MILANTTCGMRCSLSVPIVLVLLEWPRSRSQASLYRKPQFHTANAAALHCRRVISHYKTLVPIKCSVFPGFTFVCSATMLCSVSNATPKYCWRPKSSIPYITKSSTRQYNAYQITGNTCSTSIVLAKVMLGVKIHVFHLALGRT